MAEGRENWVSDIVSAGVKLSRLAEAFSNFFPGRSRWILSEIEINPFVFDTQNRFMALDGLAFFTERNKAGALVTGQVATQPDKSLTPFFEPDGIAIVGVSTTDSSKTGNVIIENLLKLGRRDVYAVNPKGVP